jgi:hypothetical protein
MSSVTLVTPRLSYITDATHTTRTGRLRRAAICDIEYGSTFFGTLNWIDNRPLQIEEYKDIFRKAPDTRSREPSVITLPAGPGPIMSPKTLTPSNGVNAIENCQRGPNRKNHIVASFSHLGGYGTLLTSRRY